MNKKIQTFIGCNCEYDQSDIVVFGAPFDGTTSFRPGTRFAPSAMRSESFGIETYSPYQELDLSDINICDIGDLELPYGNTQRVIKMIENVTNEILNSGKTPVMLGGEHLVTLGAIKAAAKKYTNLHIIHFDAHADLRDKYIGESLSHSTIMRRVWETLGDNRIYQLGIRSGEKQEFEFAKKHTIMHKFDLSNFEEIVQILADKPVYFSLDLDVLDPSIFSGTGTPEAGGIFFPELLNAIIQLRRLNIIGCDINELCPVYDQSGVSTAVACKILREILLTIKGE